MTQTNIGTGYSRPIRRVAVAAAVEQDSRLAVDNLVAQYSIAQAASASLGERRHVRVATKEKMGAWHTHICTCEEFVEVMMHRTSTKVRMAAAEPGAEVKRHWRDRHVQHLPTTLTVGLAQTQPREAAAAEWQTAPSILRTLNLADIAPHSDPNDLNATLSYLASQLVAAGLSLPQRLVLDDRELPEFPDVVTHHEAFRELVELSFCGNRLESLDDHLLLALPQLRSLHLAHNELRRITPQFVEMGLERNLRLHIAFNKLSQEHLAARWVNRDGAANLTAIHNWFLIKQEATGWVQPAKLPDNQMDPAECAAEGEGGSELLLDAPHPLMSTREVNPLIAALWEAIGGLGGLKLALVWRNAGMRASGVPDIDSEELSALAAIGQAGGGFRGFSHWATKAWPELQCAVRQQRSLDAKTQVAQAGAAPDTMGIRAVDVRACLQAVDVAEACGTRRSDIIDEQEECELRRFVVDDLLSETECNALIRETEALGYESLESSFPSEYRVSQRVMAFDAKAAAVLYGRLIQHMRRTDFEGMVPLCFGEGGTWKPLYLNECIKFSKYEQGGMFKPHQDGPWVPREDQASLLTVLIYLNDDFQGGETAFDPPPKGPRGNTTGGPPHIRGHTIQPQTGRALVFAHQAWHGGNPVTPTFEGRPKYIMRTEVVFQRVDLLQPARYSYLDEPLYWKARRLYELSRAFDHGVSSSGFVDVYKQVLSLQCTASEAAVQAHAARSVMVLTRLLGRRICHLILMLIPVDHLRSLRLVSYGWCHAATDAELWQMIYRERFPVEYQLENSAQQGLDPFLHDWFGTYWRRATVEHRFQPIVLHFDPMSVGAAVPTSTSPIVAPSMCAPWVTRRKNAYHMNIPDTDRLGVIKPSCVGGRAGYQKSCAKILRDQGQRVINADGQPGEGFGVAYVCAQKALDGICAHEQTPVALRPLSSPNLAEAGEYKRSVALHGGWLRLRADGGWSMSKLFSLHPLLLVEPLQGWDCVTRSRAVAAFMEPLRCACVGFVNLGVAMAASKGICDRAITIWLNDAHDKAYLAVVELLNGDTRCQMVADDDAVDQIKSNDGLSTIQAMCKIVEGLEQAPVLVYCSTIEDEMCALLEVAAPKRYRNEMCALLPTWEVDGVTQQDVLSGACLIGATEGFRDRCIFKIY